MGDSTIPNLPSNSSLQDTDLAVIEQSAGTRKSLLSTLANYVVQTAKSFTPSGTGAIATTVQARGRLIIYPQDFGAAGDLTTDDATALGNAITRASAIAAASGSVVEIDGAGYGYLVGSTLTLPSLVVLKNCKLKAKDSLNADVIRTANFATLTGTTAWLTSAGVPYGFGLRNIVIDGNKANQSSGNGVSIFGKNYVAEDVLVYNAKDTGFYSECGNASGQTDQTDMPEGRISGLHIWKSGGNGFTFYGPHDMRVQSAYVSTCGLDGVTFDTSSNHSGDGDVGEIHSYSNSGHGIVINASIRADLLVGESNVKDGVRFAGTGCIRPQVALVQAYNNDSAGAATYYEVNMVSGATQPLLGIVRTRSTKAVAGGVFVGANRSEIKSVVAEAASSATAKTGVTVDANNVLIGGGESLGWSGSGGIGLKTNVSSRSNGDITLKISDSETLWNNANTGGVANRYNIVLNGGAGQTAFSGNGPKSDGTEIWQARGVSNSTTYLSKQSIGSGNFAVDSTGAKSVAVTHNLLSTPLITNVNVTAIKQTNVADYVIGVLRVTAVSSTQVTFEAVISTASGTAGAVANAAVTVSL